MGGSDEEEHSSDSKPLEMGYKEKLPDGCMQSLPTLGSVPIGMGKQQETEMLSFLCFLPKEYGKPLMCEQGESFDASESDTSKMESNATERSTSKVEEVMETVVIAREVATGSNLATDLIVGLEEEHPFQKAKLHSKLEEENDREQRSLLTSSLSEHADSLLPLAKLAYGIASNLAKADSIVGLEEKHPSQKAELHSKLEKVNDEKQRNLDSSSLSEHVDNLLPSAKFVNGIASNPEKTDSTVGSEEKHPSQKVELHSKLEEENNREQRDLDSSSLSEHANNLLTSVKLSNGIASDLAKTDSIVGSEEKQSSQKVNLHSKLEEENNREQRNLDSSSLSEHVDNLLPSTKVANGTASDLAKTDSIVCSKEKHPSQKANLHSKLEEENNEEQGNLDTSSVLEHVDSLLPLAKVANGIASEDLLIESESSNSTLSEETGNPVHKPALSISTKSSDLVAKGSLALCDNGGHDELQRASCASRTSSDPISFSGPIISYSGVISYSGRIPHSGSISIGSDSSTSTRSFAFPVLASEWNSSPAKLPQPDPRYFRRRRRWQACGFCCIKPSTFFD